MAIGSGRALVLRRTPYGESSLVVQLLTEHEGRVHVLAKGAYRPTSRYFAVLDLFDTLELCELAARPGQAEGDLFRLLEDLLDTLDEGPEGPPPNLTLVVFELRFLQNLGLAPSLERCAACGGEASPVTTGRAAFSASAGGRLCRPHADEARAAGRRVGTMPVEVLDAAAALLSGAPAPPTTHDLRERLRDFVGRFLDYHLETRPASHRNFLAAPNRNAPAPRS
jgi:DNA repair protein RecO (recombination protein O)